MDYLLAKLTQQVKVEARESLRLIVSNLNGLAGLFSMEAESVIQRYDVMCWYEEAIRTWEKYKQYDVDCDKLQRIHVLENLAEMLEQVGWSTMPTREGFMALYPEYKRPSDNIEGCVCDLVGLREDRDMGGYGDENSFDSNEDYSDEFSSVEDYFDSDGYDDIDGEDIVDSDLADVRSDLADVRSDLADVRSELADVRVRSDLAGIDSDLADVRSDLADVRSDLADVRSELADVRFRSDLADVRVRSDLADVRRDLAGVRSDLADVRSDLADVRSDLADIDSDLADIDSDLADIDGVTNGDDVANHDVGDGVANGDSVADNDGVVGIEGFNSGGGWSHFPERGAIMPRNRVEGNVSLEASVGQDNEELDAVTDVGDLGTDSAPLEEHEGVAQVILNAEQEGVTQVMLNAEQEGVAQVMLNAEQEGMAQVMLNAEQEGVAQVMLNAEQEGVALKEQPQNSHVESPTSEQTDVTQEVGVVHELPVEMTRESENMEATVVGAQEDGVNPQPPVTEINGVGGASEPSSCDVQVVDQDEGKSDGEKQEETSHEEKLVLKIDFLLSEAKRLREEYAQKERDTVLVAMTTVQSNRQNTLDALDKLSEDDKETHWSYSLRAGEEHEPVPWWTSVLLCFQNSPVEKEILLHLQSLIGGDISQFKNLSSLDIINDYISDKIMSLKQKHEVFWEDLENLFNMTNSNHKKKLLEHAVICHLDRDLMCEEYRMCPLCQCKVFMVEYQGELFSHKTPTNSVLPGVGEECLKVLLSVARLKSEFIPQHLLDAGEAYLNYLEALRKEYPGMLQLWIAMEFLLGKRYELFQAKAKLFLYRGITRRQHYLNHKSQGFESSYVGRGVNETMVPVSKVQWKHEKNQSVVNLKKQIGRLVYLNNLEAQQNRSEDECCAVCTSEMGTKLGMFPCGHTYCKKCTSVMLHRPAYLVTCPMCREPCSRHGIRYVVLESRDEGGGNGEWEEPVANVNHTSKILSVVKTLLSIQRKEPGAKTLVFSWWADVLTHISHSLDENFIKHVLLTTKKFQTGLSSFKTDPNVNVLLMPFRLGSKGLNIVEATHVLLVEPQLNLGTELQAIGRVHRIGQTKPTTVHRFVVSDTVEEHIYEWTKKEHQELTAEEALLECGAGMTLGDVRKMLESTSMQDNS